MNKPITLIGYIGEVINDVKEATDGGTAELVTAEDVKAIVAEIVNETFLNSVTAKTSALTTETIDGKTFVFANGTPITIEAKLDGSEGAIIKWDGGELEVDAKAQVFAGRHNDDTNTNTSVIMNGGTVWSVYGGGLHKSHTVKANVVINDGVVSNVCGGGAAALTTACGCVLPKTIDECVCVTDDAHVEIHGGSGMGLVYGGGQGLSYTKKATTIIDGTPEMNYFTSACVNGKTDVANATINGGKINVLQGLNRGMVDEITTVINGGEINKAFVGGELPFIGSPEKPHANDPSGTFKKATMEINGGTIGEVSLGGNAYAEITEESECFANTVLVDNRA